MWLDSEHVFVCVCVCERERESAYMREYIHMMCENINIYQIVYSDNVQK